MFLLELVEWIAENSLGSSEMVVCQQQYMQNREKRIIWIQHLLLWFAEDKMMIKYVNSFLS